MDNQSKITKVRKNDIGNITEVMLATGTTHPLNEAITMAKNGSLEGVVVSKTKTGSEYLRGIADGVQNNNLDSLPTF